MACFGCHDDTSAVCAKTQALFGSSAGEAPLKAAAEQEMAVGFLGIEGDSIPSYCTATLIAPRWVLSARHCAGGEHMRFGVGPDAYHPLALLAAKRVVLHDKLDLMLIELERPPSEVVAIDPIPPLRDPLDEEVIGQALQLTGYGRRETGETGEQRSMLEPVSGLGQTYVAVRGEGSTGACRGDSGGPLLTRERDGSLRVAGVLSIGSKSCTGVDLYLRLEPVRVWIEATTQLDPREVDDCEALGAEGLCHRERAIWCEAGRRQVRACDACGWLEGEGFRCLTAASCD